MNENYTASVTNRMDQSKLSFWLEPFGIYTWKAELQETHIFGSLLNRTMARYLGCFTLSQNFGKFRSKRKWNGSAQVEIFRSKWFTHQRWSSLTGGSGWPKLVVPFPKILVSSPTLLSSSQNCSRNANGRLFQPKNAVPFSFDNSAGMVCNWLVWKNWKHP